MYWAALIVVNLPIFLFLAWIVFDTKDKAADTFFETIVALLKIILMPRIVRVLMDDNDDSGALGIVPIGIFFIACGLIVYGEHWLLTTYVFTP